MAEPIYGDTSCTGSLPLVVGTARGVRTFYLDEDGWLRGVTYRAAWRDGENVARCYVTRPLHSMVRTTRASLGAAPAPYVMGGVVFEADPDVPPVPEEGHEFVPCTGVEARCGCGFYAYHHSESRYATTGPGCRVVGVVEAYGKVVLGTAGFRAEKARIVGLVVPPITEAMRNRARMDRTVEDIRDAISELNALAARRWWHTPAVAIYAAAAAVAAACAVVPGYMVGALLVAGFAVANARIAHLVAKARMGYTATALGNDLAEIIAARARMPADYSVHIERARRNYPGVRFFDSEDEMREAFPVESLSDLARAHRAPREESDG